MYAWSGAIVSGGQWVANGLGVCTATNSQFYPALAELLRRAVKVVEAPLDAVVPTFMSFGMSQHMADLYREMYASFVAGALGWEGKGERVRGSIGVKEGLRAMLG